MKKPQQMSVIGVLYMPVFDMDSILLTLKKLKKKNSKFSEIFLPS